MSELAFKYFCCQCFKQLQSGTGVVLSCGDFVCMQCVPNYPLTTCPACNIQNQSAPLKNPHEEISAQLSDTSDVLERFYEITKFQTNHYKKTIARASARILYLEEALAVSNASNM
jgi:hypothetical protein